MTLKEFLENMKEDDVKKFDKVVVDKYKEAIRALPDEHITELEIYLVDLEHGAVGRDFNYGVFCSGKTEKGAFVEKVGCFGSNSDYVAKAVAERLQFFYKQNFNLDVRIQKSKPFQDREDFPEEKSEN